MLMNVHFPAHHDEQRQREVVRGGKRVYERGGDRGRGRWRGGGREHKREGEGEGGRERESEREREGGRETERMERAGIQA